VSRRRGRVFSYWRVSRRRGRVFSYLAAYMLGLLLGLVCQFAISFEHAQPTTLKLNIEHAALGMSFRELRFPEDITLHGLKTKLVSRTGSDPKNMQLRSADGQLLEGEDKTLRELGLTPENSNLTLTDTDSSSIGNTAFDEPKNFQGVVAAHGDQGFAEFRAHARANVNADGGGPGNSTTAAADPPPASKDDQDEL